MGTHMKIIEGSQYTDLWWSVRRSIPTASEFSNIITPAKGELSKGWFKYVSKLIADRLDPNYGKTEDYISSAMKMGNMLESEARSYYEFTNNTTVKQVCFCTSDDGRWGMSPDGLIGDDGILESKSPNPDTHISYCLEGILPVDYKPQCHAELAISGRPWLDFMSYRLDLPFIIRVYPDEYTEAVRKAMDAFYPRYEEAWAKISRMLPEPVPVTNDPQSESLPPMF